VLQVDVSHDSGPEVFKNPYDRGKVPVSWLIGKDGIIGTVCHEGPTVCFDHALPSQASGQQLNKPRYMNDACSSSYSRKVSSEHVVETLSALLYD
jgi:hypothetical protein